MSFQRYQVLCNRSDGVSTREIRCGAIQGRIRTSPPPPFGGPPNFIKRNKTSRVCAQKRRVLVLSIYPDPPPPLSKILYPPLQLNAIEDAGQFSAIFSNTILLVFYDSCTTIVFHCHTFNLNYFEKITLIMRNQSINLVFLNY